MQVQPIHTNSCKKELLPVFRQAMRYFVLFLLLVTVSSMHAQTDKKVKKTQSGNTINTQAIKLSESLEQSASDETVAGEYAELAKDLSDKKDYVRAEDYLKRALTIYLKLKKNDRSSFMYRELAKVQEMQGRTADAIANYKNAARFAADDTQKLLNKNDADRLGEPLDLTVQSAYIQQNIDLAANSNSVPEQISARRQMAGVKLAQNDNQGALEELEKALEESKSPEVAKDVSFQIKQEIANTLVTDKKHEEAIGLNKELVDEARRTNNPETEVKQLQNLATSYFEAGETSDGISSLQEAYSTAIEKGLTLDAKKVLEQIVRQYEKERKTSLALAAYSDFIGKLDTLVKNDSTLVDEKIFRLQEDKITQLEKERMLKDELITKKNRYNNVLIVLILLSLVIIVKILFDSIRKNKKIALQSLRREMNPHFIFNSLNSVNQFISENNELEANKYLSSYSKLMRTIMENSNKDFIPLSTELEQLREYLGLEQLRFRDKFTYTIHVDETLDADSVMIPNMLIQPQLENAVWHGLRYKEEAGILSLSVFRKGEDVCIIVEDNGIGIKKSRELKTAHQKARHSRGQTNTLERIDLLNHLYHTKITMEIIDKSGEDTGVVVTLCFPRIDRKKMG
ncbi:MAG: histidine kinase [Tannerella sp.]|jgi:tetratricopeptide (TPR) repeat protein|nr:histidine kinase [Tannerella sp.]